ncbi:MAG: nucleoside deaminase [Geminicoccaceae bacterium]
MTETGKRGTGETEKDIAYLRKTIEIAHRSRERGNHPFGCLLVDAKDQVILESENSFTADGGPGHAETNLAREAAKSFDWDYLATCTLYTSIEPCCMCAGTVYWSGIGAVVFGVTEARLGDLTGDHPENLTMDLPCRTVFDAGRRSIEVRGPYPELEDEILADHQDFWT